MSGPIGLRSLEPWVRAAIGGAGLAAIGLSVRRDRVSGPERAIFQLVNALPDQLYPPAWFVMQAGTIGAVPTEVVLALVAGRRKLAGRLLVGGTATWLLAKAVKRIYQRPRPAGLLSATRCRGAEQKGLGYVSGHAGIAVATMVAALPELPVAGRCIALAVAPSVGAARIYIGAHLPLDVLGGAALGLAVSGVVDGVLSHTRPPNPRR